MKLSAGAFSDDGVVKTSESMVRVLLHASRNADVMKNYKVQGYPTMVFLDPEGKQVDEIVGFVETAEVKSKFESVIGKYTRGPKWMESAEKALEAGKSDSKPVVLCFGDDKPKSQAWVKTFGDASLKPELLEKCAFAKHAFKKDDETCKKWKVTEAPTLLIVDNTGDEAKVLKTMKGGKAAEIKKALEDAVKAMEKK